MDGNIICKTMLYAYKDLERKCKRVDNELLRVGVNSYSRHILEAFDKMANLIQEKRAYCNVKVIIDEAIKETQNIEELKNYHILGISIKDIAIRFDIKENTIIKRLIRQEKKLFEAILKKYEDIKLFKIIADSKWLMNKYREFIALEKQKG